jgi:hypothetical protein
MGWREWRRLPPRKKGERMRGLGLTVLILLGLYAGWKLAYPTYTYRYRLTVDVLVDGEIKTGTGVIEVSATPGPAWLRGMNYAAEIPQARGEEVGVKLRDMMPWIKKGALVDKTKN